jgi:hypothetical protein
MTLGAPMTSSDMYLAVSPTIIAMTTNEKVQLRCRSGGLLTGTPTFPLRGADLASGLFVTNPPDDTDPTKPRRMFDPRIIYDNYDGRFWMVASEDGTAPDGDPNHTFDVGRIHLMASRPRPPSPGLARHGSSAPGASAPTKALSIFKLQPLEIRNMLRTHFLTDVAWASIRSTSTLHTGRENWWVSGILPRLRSSLCFESRASRNPALSKSKP